MGRFKASFPEVLRGFWLDVKLFVDRRDRRAVARAGDRARRSRRARVLPAAAARDGLRRRAARRADDPRRLPGRVRRPGARALAASRPTRSVLGGVALALSLLGLRRRGLPRRHRLGAPQPARGGARVGLTGRRRCASSMLPQAVRRVVPPLLNDFIALQKDVALVSILGPLEAFRVAQIDASSNFNYTPLRGRGAAVPVRDGAARAHRRPDAARTGAGRDAVLEVRGVTKAYGDAGVLRGIDLAVPEHQAVVLIGASGSGKSTLLRCVDLLEEIDDGDVLLDGEVITDPSVDPVAVRRRLGHGLPGVQPLPAPDRARERRARAGARARRAAREARSAARELLAASGSAGARTSGPTASPAASSSAWRSSARWPREPRALLLDEVTSALDPELVGEVLERRARAQGRRHDDDHRHARDGVRPRRRGRGLLPARGPHPRARRRPSGSSARRSSRRRSASCGGCWRRDRRAQRAASGGPAVEQVAREAALELASAAAPRGCRGRARAPGGPGRRRGRRRRCSRGRRRRRRARRRTSVASPPKPSRRRPLRVAPVGHRRGHLEQREVADDAPRQPPVQPEQRHQVDGRERHAGNWSR